MSDSGSPVTPVDGDAWAAPGSAHAVSGGPPTPLTGAIRDGAAPIDEMPRSRRRWTPPPRRGLVPLRPIPLGVVLSAPFRLQRRTPRTTLAPALVLSLVTTSVALLAQWALTVGPLAALDAAYYDDFQRAQNLLVVAGAVGAWVPLVLAFPATALLAGLVAVPTARALVAERVSFRGVRWRIRGRLGALIGWTLLVLVVAAGVLAAASTVPLLAALNGGWAGIGFAFGAAAVELLALVVVVGYLGARLGFTSAAITVEGLGVGRAVRRSWTLTRGSGWRLALSQLLVWTMVGLAAAVLVTPVGWAIDIAGGLIFPNGPPPEAGQWYEAGRTVVLTAVTAMAGAFGLVVQTVCNALFYLDTRMRGEGLDLTLARYVDERQRGVAVADPFPPVTAAAS